MSPRLIVFFASSCAIFGIISSIQAAHGGYNATDVNALSTGSQFALFHATALLGIAALTSNMRFSAIKLGFAAFGMLSGIMLFSGSLYARVVLGIPSTFAPIGGYLLIGSWILLIFSSRKDSKLHLR